jgi:excisionase family DNA binding protein
VPAVAQPRKTQSRQTQSRETQPRETQQQPLAHQYLSVDGAAGYLGVSAQTIYRLIDAGELPAYRLGKRLIKVQLADLDGLLHRIPAVGQ